MRGAPRTVAANFDIIFIIICCTLFPVFRACPKKHIIFQVVDFFSSPEANVVLCINFVLVSCNVYDNYHLCYTVHSNSFTACYYCITVPLIPGHADGPGKSKETDDTTEVE